MKGFFSAILCFCTFALCFVSCNKTNNTPQTVSFDILKVDTVCPLFSTYDKPSCHLSVQMNVPAEDTDKSIGQPIERFITVLPKDGAFEEPEDGSVETMIKAYVRAYVFQYLSEGPDAIDSYGEDMDAAATWMSYEENVDGMVLYNSNNLLSYQVRVNSYTGGAHGSTKTYNGVFDMQKLEALTLSSFFNEGSLQELNDKLRSKLARQYNCESVEKLAETQLFFAPAEIEATENFYVNDTTINWMFDPYDIAPYSTGEVQISLTWEEVQTLLKEDAPKFESVTSK